MANLDKEIYRLVLIQLDQKYPGIEEKKKLIEDSFYWERMRLSDRRRRGGQEAKFYSRLQKKYMSDEKQINSTYRAIIKNHLLEIQGNYSDRLYAFVRKVLTHGLKYFINEFRFRDFLTNRQKLISPQEKIHIEGYLDEAKKISEKCTIIVVPNHISNFDSVIIGYGLSTVGLPPFFYGAGLNLFTNPVISFFMHNLGAYKVDREKRHILYKEILKAYSVAMLQLGHHSLFFPGGTRLRSGGLENKLKRGLLGTAITAYSQNLLDEERKQKSRFVFVPLIMNYQVVMEAKSLIKDYFKKVGQQKYLGDPPDLSKVKGIFRKIGFLKHLDTEIFIRLGQPLDILGNPVDENGNSVRSDGTKVDLDKYFFHKGKPVADENRDRIYTGFLADKIADEYQKNNILTKGNLVCYSLYNILKKKHSLSDMFDVLYLTKEHRVVLKENLLSYMSALQDYFARLKEGGTLHTEPGFLEDAPEKIILEVEKRFGQYYYPEPIENDVYQIEVKNTPVLIYYANRIRLVKSYNPPEPVLTEPSGGEKNG
jgi:glycerol-3-phosphate O-acyltransferase